MLLTTLSMQTPLKWSVVIKLCLVALAKGVETISRPFVNLLVEPQAPSQSMNSCTVATMPTHKTIEDLRSKRALKHFEVKRLLHEK